MTVSTAASANSENAEWPTGNLIPKSWQNSLRSQFFYLPDSVI
jgi:hypothetical protein